MYFELNRQILDKCESILGVACLRPKIEYPTRGGFCVGWKYFLLRWKYSNGCQRGSPQPRSMTTNDIAVVLLVAPGRHQWAHNQLFASTAITYQLAEWLSGLSMGPSGLSCLSLLLRRTRRCRAKKKKNSRSIWVPRQASAGLRRAEPWGEVGTALNPLLVSPHLASTSHRAHPTSNLSLKPSFASEV